MKLELSAAWRRLGRLWRRDLVPAPDPELRRNWDAQALRAEFKRRYLSEFGRYVAEDMVVNQNAAINFVTLAALMAGLSFGGPAGLVVGAGLAWRHMAIRRDFGDAVYLAGKRLRRDLDAGTNIDHAGIEAWLDRHEDDLPDYLDKLDRTEGEQRAVRRLIQRVNKAGSAAGLTTPERQLLARHCYRRLTPPIQPILRLPPRTGLGTWHHGQLARALWRDVAAAAGERGRPWKRLFGLARIEAIAAKRER